MVLGGINNGRIYTRANRRNDKQQSNRGKERLILRGRSKQRVTSETDRRVESGIQKGLETSKLKWETEYSERAKLSADELAKKNMMKN